VQFLLTLGDRKKMKEKQVRFRVKAEEKEDGEMSLLDDVDWWKDLSLDGDDCFCYEVTTVIAPLAMHTTWESCGHSFF
jgi:hypothetical protein